MYSTYLGGMSSDSGYGIVVDSESYAYVTGESLFTDFPVQNAFQPTKVGYFDAIVFKIGQPQPAPPAFQRV